MKSIRKFKFGVDNKLYASPFVISYNPKTYQIKERELRRLIEIENNPKSEEYLFWKDLRQDAKYLKKGAWLNSEDANIFKGFSLSKNGVEVNITIHHLDVADIDYFKACYKKYLFNNKQNNYTKVNFVLIDCYMQIK